MEERERTLKICMTGFGAVGQRFCRLLQEKEQQLREDYGRRVVLTGICTPSRGTIIAPEGIDLETLFEMEEKKQGFSVHPLGQKEFEPLKMIEGCKADCLFELSTLSIRDGEPAATYMKKAFSCGMHVITANKGPEAWRYRELRACAQAANKEYLFETIVMDGTPVFNLMWDTLHGNELEGIRGILNGTTNFILDLMEKGASCDEAIKEAQRIQLAEADPSMDIDGWDGAAKLCAMVNILMNGEMTPDMVETESLQTVSAKQLQAAVREGKKIKYICKAERDKNGQIRASVKPEQISKEDPFINVNGTSAAVTLFTDLAGELTIVQSNPGILQTAYGVLSDLITLLKGGTRV